MNRGFSRTLLLLLLGSTANFAYSQPNALPNTADIVISTGREGGGYWKTGSRLQSVASGMGLSIQNVSSVGSINNLRDLLDPKSRVSLAFAQADALQYYLDKNPDAVPAVEKLADIGNECVFIISDADGDLDTLEDMVDASRLHIGITSASSGSRVTWDYMATLVPGLKDNTTIASGDPAGMMTDLAHPLTDIERAVMTVQDPNVRSPAIDAVIANPDRFQFVEIDDERLTRKSPRGDVTYQSMKVKPGGVGGASAVKTICVRGLLLANMTKLTEAQRNSLSELINTRWSEVRPSTD
jgi:TRAP-type uncharacterized transport system substrate-binding protein